MILLNFNIKNFEYGLKYATLDEIKEKLLEVMVEKEEIENELEDTKTELEASNKRENIQINSIWDLNAKIEFLEDRNKELEAM